MRSSTSSSDPTAIAREIPAKPWLRMLAVTLALVAGGLAWWEQQVRADGYAPTYNDTPNLWAERRALAEGVGPEQIVFVGTSRTLFDMDLEVFEQATGHARPIQLATVGSNPLIVLEDLAADEDYAGTTLVDITPGLIAAAGGPPVSNPKRFVDHYHAWSPAERVELPMALWLQDRLAFIEQEDLDLASLLDRRLDLPNRPDAYAPRLPGYMYTLDRDRRARMADHLAADPQAMHVVQQTWQELCSPPPKPPVFSDEEWAKMMSDGWEQNLVRLKAAVQAIEARGGRVIFQRLPSTGWVREVEHERFPRAAIWDRILRETGAPGVHFEDHPSLQGFACPEWSHLSGPDSVEYSRRLVEVLQAQGLL